MKISGKFYINEQDPYEPVGIMFKDNEGNNQDLADLLTHEFGLVPNCDHKAQKYLEITVEEK